VISISAQEIAELFRKAIRGESKVVVVGCSWNEAYCGDVKVRIDGYDLVIFNDCDEIDYVDNATAPDGRTCDFESWFEDGIEPIACLTSDELGKLDIILENAEVVSD